MAGRNPYGYDMNESVDEEPLPPGGLPYINPHGPGDDEESGTADQDTTSHGDSSSAFRKVNLKKVSGMLKGLKSKMKRTKAEDPPPSSNRSSDLRAAFTRHSGSVSADVSQEWGPDLGLPPGGRPAAGLAPTALPPGEDYQGEAWVGQPRSVPPGPDGGLEDSREAEDEFPDENPADSDAEEKGHRRFHLPKIKMPKIKGLKRVGSKRSKESSDELFAAPTTRDVGEEQHDVTSPDDFNMAPPLDQGTSSRTPSYPSSGPRQLSQHSSGEGGNYWEPYQRPGSRAGRMRDSVRHFWSGPSAPIATPAPGVDIAALKPPAKKSPLRCSIFLLGLLVSFILVGIGLLIAFGITKNYACKILGPTFLGLGFFALVGFIYFMLFWKEDPLPALNPYLDKINVKIGGVQDPYALTSPNTYGKSGRAATYQSGMGYHGLGGVPSSPLYRDAIAMAPLSYPSAFSKPPVYDELGPLDFKPAPGAQVYRPGDMDPPGDYDRKYPDDGYDQKYPDDDNAIKSGPYGERHNVSYPGAGYQQDDDLL